MNAPRDPKIPHKRPSNWDVDDKEHQASKYSVEDISNRTGLVRFQVISDFYIRIRRRIDSTARALAQRTATDLIGLTRAFPQNSMGHFGFLMGIQDRATLDIHQFALVQMDTW